VAAHAEEKRKWPAGTLLDTPWQDLSPLREEDLAHRHRRRGNRDRLEAGPGGTGAKTKFGGILAMLANRWRNAKSGIMRRMLEKLMRRHALP